MDLDPLSLAMKPAGKILPSSLDLRQGALVELVRKLLDANKDRAGQITTGNPARGQETWVYGRPGRPCRRCGTAIRTARAAGGRADPEDRVTFWCPRCQQ